MYNETGNCYSSIKNNYSPGQNNQYLKNDREQWLMDTRTNALASTEGRY